MKKILFFIGFLFTVSFVFAQHPVGTDSLILQTLGSTNTLVKSKGAISADSGFVNSRFTDTAAANRSKIKNYPYAQIAVSDTIWYRNSTATAWLKMGSGGSGGTDTTLIITIVNDSTPNLQKVTDIGYTTTNPLVSYNSVAVIGADLIDNSNSVSSPTKGVISQNINLVKNPALSWTLPWLAGTTDLYADSSSAKQIQLPNANGFLAHSVNGIAADVNGNIIDTSFRTDTAYIITTIRDSLILMGPDTTNLIFPLYAVNDSTEAFKADSLNELQYGTPNYDTTLWHTHTLIDKQYFEDRIGGVGGGSQNLNQVSAIDSAERHTILAINQYADTTAYLDSMVQKVSFASNTATSGIKGKLLSNIQSEKYNTLDPGGKKYGRWPSWFISNNYNGIGGRRGETLYSPSYNMNAGGSAELPGEGAWASIFESDFGRRFERYEQVVTSAGYVYRPWMYVYNKDTLLGDFTLKTQYWHINPIDTAANYVNFENGKFQFSLVPNGHLATVSHPLIELKDPLRTIAITNNSSALLFQGGASYGFDASPFGITNNTIDLGGNTSRWRQTFTDGLIAQTVTVPDANYTQVITDHSLSFKNITADRSLTFLSSNNGKRLELTTGQATFKVTFSGATVKQIDGTTITELPAGKSCIMYYDGAVWQLVSYSDLVGGGGGGGVTSIATTAPITGGTITTTGTIACATCVVASSPGAGVAHFAGSTQTVTSSAVNLATEVTGNLPVTNLNSGTSATSSTYWRGDGTWAAPAGAGDLLANGTVPLTANWNLGAFNITSTKTGATANTIYDGFIAKNTTTASAGNQMYGSAFHSIGNGWKTTATAASQAVDFQWYTKPVEGTTNPTGTWTLESSINGGAFANPLTFTSGGLLTAGAITSNGALNASNLVTAEIRSNATYASSNFAFTGGTTLTSNSGAPYLINSNPVSLRVQMSGATASTVAVGNDFANLVLGSANVTEAASGAHPLGSNLVVITPTTTNGTATVTNAQTAYLGDAPSFGASNWSLNVGSVNHRTKSTWDNTTTTAGTTGNQTINKSSGTVNIAAAGTTVTVTNSLVSATSLVFAVIRTNDATARIANVVPAAGSFVINIVACTAEVSIGFFVIN